MLKIIIFIQRYEHISKICFNSLMREAVGFSLMSEREHKKLIYLYLLICTIKHHIGAHTALILGLKQAFPLHLPVLSVHMSPGFWQLLYNYLYLVQYTSRAPALPEHSVSWGKDDNSSPLSRLWGHFLPARPHAGSGDTS